MNVWEVTRPNARFNASDTLVLEIHTVRMPVGFGGVNTRGRPLPIVAHLKKIIVQVKSETNCLAHALIIAIVKITNDPSYKSYRQGKKLGPLFHQLLKTVGMNLDQGGDQTTHAISGTFQSIELLFFGFKL